MMSEREAYTRTPADEVAARLERFQAALGAEGLDGALILQVVDLFYLTGAAQQGALFVPAAGEPLFLVRKSQRRAAEDSPLPAAPLRSYRELPRRLADAGFPAAGRLGVELDVLPAALYLQLDGLFDGARLVDCSATLRHLRLRKSAWEVERIRAAARRTERMFEIVPEVLREGLAEVELAAEVEAAARREGHQGLVRFRAFNMASHYGHLLSGESGTLPSYQDSATGGRGLSPAYAVSAGWRRIRRGDPVTVDYVGVFDGYHVDRTQTYSLGPMPDDLQAAYEATVRIQHEVTALARPGVTCGQLYARAIELADELGYAEGVNGLGEAKVRFIGHGIGLEVDEPPPLAEGSSVPLEAGMVLALEPKIALPGRGVVGIEHDWLVAEAGLERLTVGGDAVVVV